MKKYLPVIIIASFIILFYISGIYEYFSFEFFKKNREVFQKYIEEFPLFSAVSYISLYAFLALISFPGATFVTLIGGFLFDQPWSTLYVVIGATTGATMIFMLAKNFLKKTFKQKAEPWLKKMEKGFQEDAVSYLLTLRLIPIFPFWIVNIAPAFFAVHTPTYLWTTFIGMIPGAFAYTQVGKGLGVYLDTNKPLELSAILNAEMKIAFFSLAVLALLPTLIKKWRNKND